MTYRRRYYRRRSRSPTGRLIRDMTEIAARAPWWLSLLLGSMVFAVFYWGVPAYEAYLANKGGMAATMAQFFADRSQRVGVLLLIVALVGTALQLVFGRPLARREQRGASWLSRQLGRMIDD
jgi:hypothetical protein